MTSPVSASARTRTVPLPEDEHAAWWHMWRLHAGFIVAVVARTVPHPDLIPDAVQEVWLQIWRCRRAFRGQSQPRTWAYQIARRRALNVARADRTRRCREAEAAYSFTEEYDAPPTRDQLLLADIRAACDRLPSRQRLVFLRYALLDHSHEEIARDLGISTGTSRSQLSKARAALRLRLSHLAPSNAETVHVA
jgi:RNA polymerase sigma factor (sigma-70 family)